jgi:hypothetical protein
MEKIEFDAIPPMPYNEEILSDTHWIRRAMENELGKLDQLPLDIRHHVWAVYRDAGKAYLGWRRIQKHKASDWFPQKAVFDASLLRELKHFYSDYQQVVHALEYTRALVNRLRSVDPQKNPRRYDQLVAALFKMNFRSASVDHILERLLGHESDTVRPKGTSSQAKEQGKAFQ